MSYDYFYGQSGELFSYFRIPKALFQDHRFRQISTDARTLYGILLDRMKQYLLAMLYNAPTTMNLYYQNKTNHDFARGSPKAG